MHTTEPLVSDLSPLEVEITKFKKCKLPGSDQIPAELIQVGVEICLLRSINSLILFRIRNNWLISGRSLLLFLFTKRAIKLSVIIMGYHCYHLDTKYNPISSSQG
jgi:hypothetical protein